MNTPPKNNALAFVGQIMTAYKAVMKAEGQALKYAIECGEALNRAKENVESTKPKGRWSVWLKENCSEIQPRTERLYRQLATAVAENPDILAGCESIRSAVAKMNEKPDDDEESDSDFEEEKADALDQVDDDESGNALPHPSFATEDLIEMLENCAVDEIGKALEDADKLEEFEARVIARLTPDKVCVALTKAWPADQLRDLIKQLNTFVESLTKAPTPAPSVRRSASRVQDRASKRDRHHRYRPDWPRLVRLKLRCTSANPRARNAKRPSSPLQTCRWPALLDQQDRKRSGYPRRWWLRHLVARDWPTD